MEEISEIRLNAVAGFNNADVVCSYCLYIAEVVIEADWPVFSHPHHILISKRHAQYLRFMEICPEAIVFVTKTIDKIFCPHCGRTQLTVTGKSRYDLSSLHASLQIDKHDKLRADS